MVFDISGMVLSLNSTIFSTSPRLLLGNTEANDQGTIQGRRPE
jgi:hypothetical protein